MSKQYLYRVSILNKQKSHPLEAICYYSGENQFDMTASKKYTSNTVDNVIWNKIIVPDREEQADLFKHLPDCLKFRSFKKDIMSNARNILWQNVYIKEKREDAQFARLFEISIPSFLSQEQAIEALEKFAANLVKAGMIADCSIHSRQKMVHLSLLDRIKLGQSELEEEDNKLENTSDYQGFLMCTMRDYENGRFITKNRVWNDKKQLEEWRSHWVEILAEIVENAEISPEEKENWEEKISIYGEYENIKKLVQMNKKVLKV